MNSIYINILQNTILDEKSESQNNMASLMYILRHKNSICYLWIYSMEGKHKSKNTWNKYTPGCLWRFQDGNSTAKGRRKEAALNISLSFISF